MCCSTVGGCVVPVVVMIAVPAGNSLREDFKFLHSFSSEVAKLVKGSPGQVVSVQPEKFRSKYEPASQTLTIQVGWITKEVELYGCLLFKYILF